MPMQKHPDITGPLKAALQAAALGYRRIPIAAGAKGPPPVKGKRSGEKSPCICHARAEQNAGVVLPSVSMAEQPATSGNYAIALANAEKGYVSIPLLPGTKIPAVKWKRFQTEKPSPELYRA